MIVRAPTHTVLYDGSCPLCRRAVARLQSWDSDGRLEFLSSDSPRVETDFSWISREELAEALHLVGVGKKTWAGARAVEELVRLLPTFRLGSWIFRLPFARTFAKFGYRHIAQNRNALGCDEHCSSE